MKSPHPGLRVGNSSTLFFIFILILTSGCSTSNTPTAVPDTLVPSTPTSPPLTPSPTSSPTSTPTLTPTPDPYEGITIEDLQSRTYGEGEIEIEGVMEENEDFIRFLISYISDGVKIYGFMNLPNEAGPFPVVVVVHGYVTPSRYRTLAYTTPLADALVREGYLVFHPNYRNHPPSDEGPNPFRVGYAIDVLNLVGILEKGAGQAGLLEIAIPDKLGLFGHSMGGGITLRSVTAYPGIDAAVMYAAISGDERINHEHATYWANTQDELEISESDLQRISSIHHLEDIQTPMSIHHGLNDTVVPPEWSTDLCDRMMAIAKEVECFDYPGQPHRFTGSGFELFMERVLVFFDKHLKDS